MGLYWSLNMLGYRTYHMVEVLGRAERDLPLLIEAFDQKYSGGKPYGREEFDKWYGDYDVSSRWAEMDWDEETKQLTGEC